MTLTTTFHSEEINMNRNTVNRFFSAYAGVQTTDRHVHGDYFWPEGCEYVLIKGFLGDRNLELQFFEEKPLERYLPIGYTAYSREEYIELISRSDICSQIRSRS